jgi:hypothetical protein
VHATSGRVVAAKEQRMLGGGRLGYVVALGSPSLDSQWWFADGEHGAGITEQYAIYNPGERSVSVDVVLLGLAADALADPTIANQSLDVPAGGVEVFSASDIVGVPDGRHAVVVSSASSDAIVVERALTRPISGSNQVSTTVVLGAPSTYVAQTWHVPIGVTFPLDQALVVYNTSFAEATVTVSGFGPGGAVAVPGLESLSIAANGVLAIDLTDAAAIGTELVVTSTSNIIVERRLARGGDDTVRGRTGSFAIPEF